MMTQTRDRLTMPLLAITGLVTAAAVYFAFGYAPTADVLSGGDVQRIFYFHVGIAWIAGLALFVTFIFSILYLWRGEQRKYDIVAAASAEIGIVFGVMVLLSGMLWARPVWNTWWTWDPRLTTTALTEFIYVAYLMLRGALEDPQRRARFSAVYGIIGFASVPITFFSTKWFNTIHPDLFDGKSLSPLTATMRPAMFISLAAFTLIYIVLLRARSKVEQTADVVAQLKQEIINA
ncbi:MAG TPA: cytochrome c biogenesis protein CcsA [Anaerolineae bacterium]|nr:cytochrome c biogenesis protein CcsA [Anaerolineae bacterium]